MLHQIHDHQKLNLIYTLICGTDLFMFLTDCHYICAVLFTFSYPQFLNIPQQACVYLPMINNEKLYIPLLAVLVCMCVFMCACVDAIFLHAVR